MDSLSRLFRHHFTSGYCYQKLTHSDEDVSGEGPENPFNEPAPMAACRTGDLRWLKEIMKREPVICQEFSCRQSGNMVSLLFLAAQLGHLDIVRLLADHGADLDWAGDDGCTPLHVAIAEGHLDRAYASNMHYRTY